MNHAYTVFTVSPPRYVHSRCLEELSLGLVSALREGGYRAGETGLPEKIEGRSIVLGAHLLPRYPGLTIPADAIIYNTEQVDSRSDWMTGSYIDELRRRVVWDYSHENIAAWKRQGIQAVYCGIGYVPQLTRIPPIDHEDIDVLFYGSINARRRYILQQLLDLGVYLHIAPMGTYGKERDELISRAKLILNLHYYDAAIFEIVRCSYLFANRKCVVAEGPGDSIGGPPTVPYDQLVRACIDVLGNDERRQQLAEAGACFLRATPQLKYLESALAATASQA